MLPQIMYKMTVLLYTTLIFNHLLKMVMFSIAENTKAVPKVTYKQVQHTVYVHEWKHFTNNC